MNVYKIGSELLIGFWIGRVSFTKWFVSILDKIFVLYDTKIMFKVSMDNCIHSQMIWMTEESVMNDRISSR